MGKRGDTDRVEREREEMYIVLTLPPKMVPWCNAHHHE
jgi:hypothetical protein